MGQRTTVFGELACTQLRDILDPLHRTGSLIGGEFLITENGQTFFERQLEPVAAGYPVARPVVEIFMGDNGFDQFEIHVRRGIGLGENVFGVKDVQAFVFHRPHVEIRHGDDVEQIKIIFKTIDVFVPLHGAFQAVHRIVAAIFVAMFDKDAQRHVPPGNGFKTILDTGQVACHQCEQIGRFGEWIFPHREMTPTVEVTAVDQVAV